MRKTVLVAIVPIVAASLSPAAAMASTVAAIQPPQRPASGKPAAVNAPSVRKAASSASPGTRQGGPREWALMPPLAPTFDSSAQQPQAAPVKSSIASGLAGQQAPAATLAADAATGNFAGRSAAKKTSTGTAPVVDALLRRGIHCHGQGNTLEAERCFRQVLEHEALNCNALFNLGVLMEERGDLAGALGHYRSAAISSPSDEELQKAVVAVEQKISTFCDQQVDRPFMNPFNAPVAIVGSDPQQSVPIQSTVGEPNAAAGVNAASGLHALDTGASSLSAPLVDTGNYVYRPSTAPFQASVVDPASYLHHGQATPTLQASVQENTRLAGGQLTAASTQAGGLQANGPPLAARTSNSSGAAPMRRALIQGALRAGLTGAARVNTGSPMGNALFQGARRGLVCRLCQFASRF